MRAATGQHGPGGDGRRRLSECCRAAAGALRRMCGLGLRHRSWEGCAARGQKTSASRSPPGAHDRGAARSLAALHHPHAPQPCSALSAPLLHDSLTRLNPSSPSLLACGRHAACLLAPPYPPTTPTLAEDARGALRQGRRRTTPAPPQSTCCIHRPRSLMRLLILRLWTELLRSDLV